MKHLILLALVAASGATYGSKRQQWATGQQPELEWGRYLVGVSSLFFVRLAVVIRSLIRIFTVNRLDTLAR